MILLRNLFQQLDLELSNAEPNTCLYKSGFLDSANLLQLLLMIENSRQGKAVNLEEILSKDITLQLLENLLNDGK